MLTNFLIAQNGELVEKFFQSEDFQKTLRLEVVSPPLGLECGRLRLHVRFDVDEIILKRHAGVTVIFF